MAEVLLLSLLLDEEPAGEPKYISFFFLTPGVARVVDLASFWHLLHTILLFNRRFPGEVQSCRLLLIDLRADRVGPCVWYALRRDYSSSEYAICIRISELSRRVKVECWRG